MGMGMKYCPKCGAVVGQAENEVSMDSVRSAFAPATPVETTPAQPVGFHSLDGAPVYHVPMNNAQNSTPNSTQNNTRHTACTATPSHLRTPKGKSF